MEISSEVQGIVVTILAIWISLAGGALVVQRPDWARAVMVWPVHAVRRMVGNLLIAVGTWIRG